MDLKKITQIFGVQGTKNGPFLDNIVRWQGLSPEAKVLDIGTGRGLMAIILAMNGFEVITGEPATDHWADWRKNATEAGMITKIHFQAFQAEKMPFEGATFDAVFVYGSLHHIENKIGAIGEIQRCLKPGGVIIILEPNPKGLKMIRKEQLDHPEAEDPRQYMAAAEYSTSLIHGELFDAYVFRGLNITQ